VNKGGSRAAHPADPPIAPGRVVTGLRNLDFRLDLHRNAERQLGHADGAGRVSAGGVSPRLQDQNRGRVSRAAASPTDPA
jgi:hypothetical protein